MLMKINNSILFLILPGILFFMITFIRIPITERIEKIFLDSYISHMSIPAPNEKIILITGSDRSIQEIGMWPWPRELHAKLINEYLIGAKTIGLDILFVDESIAEGDERLREAIQNHGNVVLAYVESGSAKGSLHSLNRFIEVAAGEGYVNGYRDKDGIVRTYRLVNENRIIAPSYVAAVLMASGYDINWDFYRDLTVNLKIYDNDHKSIHVSLNENFEFFRFPAQKGSYEIYDFADVLNGKIPSSVFDDAIVFVGMNAAGAADVITASEGVISGTQYNIDSIFTLLAGKNPVRVKQFWEALLVMAVFVIVWLLTVRLRKSISWLIPVIAAISCVLINRYLFINKMIWISTPPFIFSIIGAYLFALLTKLLTAQRSLSTHTMAVDSLFDLEITYSGEADYQTFEDSIKTLTKEIKDTYDMDILIPFTSDLDKENDGFSREEVGEGLAIAYYAGKSHLRHRVLIRLPNVSGKNEEPKYTVLGMVKKYDVMTVKAVASIIISAYIYFNAIKEAKERTALFYNLIECMIAAVDAKDPVTSGHSKRVAEFSAMIAKGLGLPAHRVEQVRFAGMIHDLGKIGIPDGVLNKPGPFSDTDFKIMKEHPEKGAAIIAPAGLESEIMDGVLYHHERIDGRGYPYGKIGEELSLTARIIKIADVYDALTSERQYKKPWPLDRILNMFYENRGTEFDAHITDVFIEMIRPVNWQPVADRRQKGPISEYAVKKYREIYTHFMEVLHESNIKNRDISFHSIDSGLFKDKTCKQGFFDLLWYESFDSISFLRHHPLVIHVDKDEMFLALQGSEEIKYIIYYFSRGFLTAGYMVCTDTMLCEVTGILGEPIEVMSDFNIYDNGRMNILCGEDTVVYLMKSILEG